MTLEVASLRNDERRVPSMLSVELHSTSFFCLFLAETMEMGANRAQVDHFQQSPQAQKKRQQWLPAGSRHFFQLHAEASSRQRLQPYLDAHVTRCGCYAWRCTFQFKVLRRSPDSPSMTLHLVKHAILHGAGGSTAHSGQHTARTRRATLVHEGCWKACLQVQKSPQSFHRIASVTSSFVNARPPSMSPLVHFDILRCIL